MDLQKELFLQYQDAANSLRDEFRDLPSLAPWFERTRERPPIICFGFPRDPNERIPLATLGVNPSSREPDLGTFEKQAAYFLGPTTRWFQDAEMMLRVLSEDLPESQRASYGISGRRRNTVHLDLTPVITGAIGSVREAPADLRKLVKRGAEAVLKPLLEEFVARHGVEMLLILGNTDWLGVLEELDPRKWDQPKIEFHFTMVGPGSWKKDQLETKTRAESYFDPVERKSKPLREKVQACLLRAPRKPREVGG